MSGDRNTGGCANLSHLNNIRCRDGDTCKVPKPGFGAVPSGTWGTECSRENMPKTPNKKEAKFHGFAFGPFCVFSVCGVFGVS